MTMNRCLRLSLWLGLTSLLGSAGVIGLLSHTAIAQLVADPSLGTTVESFNAQIDLIKNGARPANGANLFHSFQEFNIGQNGAAYFIVSDANVLNILARVTGSNPSQILGVLGTRQQLADGTLLLTNANLFLMNPNGIIFGQGARLDIGGSFVATTANAIQFSDRGSFSTDINNPPSPLLTINPSAFLFNRINPTARIESRGTSGADVLQVPNGRSLLLLGGDVSIGGFLVGALGGRIEVGGLSAPGEVALGINGNTLQLQFLTESARADVSLNNQAGLFVTGAGGGDIAIDARNVSLAGRSNLNAGILAGQGNTTTQAGNITIDATDTASLTENSLINNRILNNATGKSGNVRIKASNLELSDVSGIGTGTAQNATGTAGNIELTVRSLSVASRSNLFATSLSDSDAGNIQIRATDAVRFDDSTAGSFTTGRGRGGKIDITAGSLLVTNSAFLNAATSGMGDSGEITIAAGSVRVTNGGSLGTFTQAEGNAGNLRIQADTVQFDGTAKTLSFVKNGAIFSPSQASSSVLAGARGNGGTIEITTRSLSVTNGANLSAGTLGTGNAGNIRIVAQEDVTFAGGRQNGTFADGEFRTIVSGANVSTGADGQGGNIDITTGALFVRDGAELSAYTISGRGDSGSIRITARDTVQFDGSIASQFNGRSASFESAASVGVFGSGNGGNLEISTGSLSVTNGAALIAGTNGAGNAGNIWIHARDAVRFDGTDKNPSSSVSVEGISFFSRSQTTSSVGTGSSGNGGNIEITARSLSVTNGALLSTDTLGSGNAGNIRLVIQEDTTFAGERQNGLFGNGQSINLVSGASASTASEGNGGNLEIVTGSLFLRDGTSLDATTQGSASAGEVRITARDYILLSGTDSNGVGSAISSFSLGASGNAGALTITTRSLQLQDGAFISAFTNGAGNAGAIWITARDSVSLSGKDGDGLSSAISSGVTPQATGNGNTLTINTGNLFLANDARLIAFSRGLGNAGNIVINVREALRANSGSILTRSEQSAGGSIDLTAGTIVLRGNSDIASSVFSGASNGGNITLSAHSIIALNDSDILAFARDGQGGNITLNTRAFFGQNYRPVPLGTDPATLDGNARVDINASGTVSGIITLPDVSFLQNSLTEFPQTFTDTTQLLANSCIVRREQQNGSFKITGSGGLPQRPGDAPVSPFPTGEVRSLSTHNVQTEATMPSAEVHPWKLGDPIVEPQGIYELADGQLVVSRECSP
ncbi:MAG: filamentous hemagglutinin N-terminal domain-containing protein [Lyngbya sp. HA4199-MV5]|nr:filamentous hemagglutinin N-terminal domain-containing protein [Lyngbya sp. HA4199-MV5]